MLGGVDVQHVPGVVHDAEVGHVLRVLYGDKEVENVLGVVHEAKVVEVEV